MKKIEEIIEELRTDAPFTPQILAEYRSRLAAEYSFVAEQLEKILVRKPLVWDELRGKVTSDAQADRAWERTEDGRNEIGYRLRLKSFERLSSALKSRIEVMQGEARGQF